MPDSSHSATSLVGRVYRERDYRFERFARVVRVEQEKAVVETVRPEPTAEDGWTPVFSSGRTTRIRYDNLLRPSRWEPQATLSAQPVTP